MKKKKESIEIEHGLGALPNPIDERDIPLARVQAPVAVPKKYLTDISKLRRRDQGQRNSCVGHAGAELLEFFEEIETGTDPDTSAQALYALCKNRDGSPAEGTFPRVLAKVLTDIGGPTLKTTKDDPSIPEPEYSTLIETDAVLEDAYPFRVNTNYAWVGLDVDSLKQAIYQNKIILGSIDVGKDYSDGRITPTNSRGRHYILLYGYEVKSNGDVKFYFLNSWSKDWGKDGTGYFLWSEMQGHVYDVLSFLDIPDEVLKLAKVAFKFTTTLKKGSVGNDVLELQKRLATEPALDGLPCFRDAEYATTFGPATELAVKRYQAAHNIVSSGTPETTGYGQLGPTTRNVLNAATPVKVALYPRVQEMRDKLVNIMSAIGRPIVVTDEYRTNEEQDALYAKGRTKPGSIVTNAKGGESLHNYRCAFDVAYKTSTGITYDGDFALIGTIGKILGLEWGGDWSTFKDQPHFQYTAGYTLADFQKGNIDPSKFGVSVSGFAIIPALYNPSNMTLLHRIKSAIITAISFLGAAIVTTAIAYPQALTDVITYAQGYIASLGLPAALTFFIGLVLNEIVRDIINRRKIAKLNQYDAPASASRFSQGAQDVELY